MKAFMKATKLIAYRGDHEPVQIYQGNTLIENISAIPTEISGTDFVQYESEYNKNLLSLKIEGDTEQKQYTGKNLFDISKYYSANLTDYSITENSVTVQTASTYRSANFVIPNWQDLLGKKITYSCKISRNPSKAVIQLIIRFFNGSSGVYKDNALSTPYGVDVGMGKVSVTGVITAPSDNFEEYPNAQLCVALYAHTGGTLDGGVSRVIYSDIQVELGDTVTDYEPYVGGVASPNINYPQPVQSTGDNGFNISLVGKSDIGVNLQLCKIGDYKDSLIIDYKNKKVIKHKEIEIYDFAKDYDKNFGGVFGSYDDGYNFYTCVLDLPIQPKFYKTYSTHFINIPRGGYPYDTFEINVGPPNIIRLLNIPVNDTSDVIPWLIANNVKIYYVREQPIDEDITNTEIGQQLLSLATSKGTNVIEITDDLKPPSSLNVTYVKWGGRE